MLSRRSWAEFLASSETFGFFRVLRAIVSCRWFGLVGRGDFRLESASNVVEVLLLVSVGRLGLRLTCLACDGVASQHLILEEAQ